MKLKIVADGQNPEATKIVNSDTGELIENVGGVEVSLDALGVEVAIIMNDVELEIDNLEVTEVRDSDTEGDGRDGGDSDN